MKWGTARSAGKKPLREYIVEEAVASHGVLTAKKKFQLTLQYRRAYERAWKNFTNSTVVIDGESKRIK